MDNKEIIIIKIMAELGEIVDIEPKKMRAVLDESFNGYSVEKESYDVAPHAGAWIEISNTLPKILSSISRPSRRGVD